MPSETRVFKFLHILVIAIIGIAFMSAEVIASEGRNVSHVLKITLEIVSHIGAALFIMALVGILLETKHWSAYFEERLSKVIVKKEFLQTLDPETLIAIQKQVLQNYFHDDSLGSKGDFFSHYESNIQSLLGKPYRRALRYVIQCSYQDERIKETLIVSKTLQWECKAAGGKIQPFIHWEPAPAEYNAITDYSVKLRHPDLKQMKAEWTKEELVEITERQGKQFGFYLPITDYQTLDTLLVEMNVQFTIPYSRTIAWLLSYATKGIHLSVSYPDDLLLLPIHFFNHIDAKKLPNEKGFYLVESDNWFLPDEGIVLQFYREAN